MFKYKDASFYTSYFEKLPEFKVIEEFKKSDDEEEKNLYVGMVEVLNTVHPLVIRVEIPEMFPHMKLTFRTKSIGGYPHLIHTGKIKYGDWFCLNTPFAETPEGQLEQECMRLKEWIHHQLREDLPPFIKDRDVAMSLLFANAYDWENPDEMNEFSSKAFLTFVGEHFQDSDNFKAETGHFNCIKTHDNRYYVIKDKAFSNFEVPYIIVDELPKSNDTLLDFIALKEQYGWDDTICKRLLPKFNTQEWRLGMSVPLEVLKHNTTIGEEEALNMIQRFREELSKEESYLPGLMTSSNTSSKESAHPLYVLPTLKPLIAEKLDELEKRVKKDKGVKIDFGPDWNTEEGAKYWDEFDYWNEIGVYKLQPFVLGIKDGKRILWIVLATNEASGLYEKNHYDFFWGIEILRLENSSPMV